MPFTMPTALEATWQTTGPATLQTTMEVACLALVAFLMLNIAAGLARIVRGPTAADRMLAAQLFGTTGVAVLLLLAEAQAMPSLRDAALVFAALAVLATLAFVRRVRQGSGGASRGGENGTDNGTDSGADSGAEAL